MSNIKILKLVSCEEVMAYISINEELLVFELKNVVQLRMIPSMSQGGPQMAMMQFPLGSSDKSFVISERHIIYCVSPDEDFINQYKQIFSEIFTPNQNIII